MQLATIRLGIFVALVSLSEFAAAAESALYCPTEINVEQKAMGSLGEWTVLNSQAPHPFINVSFSEGEPGKRVVLSPSKEKKQKGALVSIWEFNPSSYGYWISCIYRDTGVVLARKLSNNTKTCEVEYDKNFSVPIVKNFKCL